MISTKNKMLKIFFYTVQGGFDYGENINNTRYFYGGSFDYLKIYGNDAGYNGLSSSLWGLDFMPATSIMMISSLMERSNMS
ncbi:hypothetical protein [Helicobacter mustelae]|uniref:hypothetical protein n=1 Tax=Helicobacter mustelae TaxID=217 RepID=UPI0015EFE4BA|nr:hypothetical protein [Helicobacter mustelae]